MKHIKQIIATCCLLTVPLLGNADKALVDYVNPNIGVTHSRWFFYTPAAVPFGMAKLGPSTDGTYGNTHGWEAVGYQDNHRSIDGFPCLHEFQIGGVSLMPVTGAVKTIPGRLENPSEGWRSTFVKKSEHSKPGYYRVRLSDYDVTVELTATKRVGFQRFTFPRKKEGHILLNIGNRQGESGQVVDAKITKTGAQTIEGYVITKPQYVINYQSEAVMPMYFYAWVSEAPQDVSVFLQGDKVRQDNQIKGKGAVMSLDYAKSPKHPVTVKIGLSYTSIENARKNFEAEAQNLTFDEAKAQAQNVWNDWLGRITVKDKSTVNKTKFYTGLYHALLGRGVASDVSGSYPRNDGTVGQIPLSSNGKPQFNHYNTDAMWGGYWNLTPLWALAYPDYYNDFVNSQLLVYQDAGWLGDGIAASRYVSGVGTNMMSIVIAGAYNSGIRNFDMDKAYDAVWKNEAASDGRLRGAGKLDVAAFMRLGYVPYKANVNAATELISSQFAASHTMEYCFSAYAFAQWAKALGKDDVYRQFMQLSNGWTKLFNDSLKLIHPRDLDGKFIDNFKPLEPWRGFQEGNAMQYTFFVPQNPKLLVSKVGKDRFNNMLDSIFIGSEERFFCGGKSADAFSGVTAQYNHGNQPCLQMSWLFNFSGKPWLTQKWTRAICDGFYGMSGDHGYGYAQDEDQGQLGAWYVLAAMGLFDVQGGAPIRPTYQLGSPMFDEVKVRLNPINASGKELIIRTIKHGKNPIYVQKVTFNGQPVDQCWLYRDQLYKGGVLEFVMGDQPNENWGQTIAPDCPQ
ncbi:MAG: GH92 family glycosyl hydrolase [Prevotella sp.]|jgi:predicted alpha-1,2-mannosidase